MSSIYESLVESYSLAGLLLVVAVAALLAVQLYYYLGVYARIPGYRNIRDGGAAMPHPSVSVVVVVRDEMAYVTETLPLILAQQYDDFEVVVVDMSSQSEVTDALAVLAAHNPRLRVSRLIQQEKRFPITNKMAVNVGIKAAAYSNIVFTTTEASPSSPMWLSLMAKGFIRGQVVVGYCGIARAPGFANRMIRAGRLNTSMRYLGAAIKGMPYRGTQHNIGYSSELYFGAKGFDHLSLDAGEDDLFIQRIATPANTSVVMNPKATMRQQVWGNAADWFRREMKARSAWRYYPLAVRNYIEWETWSRVLLTASCITVAACMPPEMAVGAGTVLLLRFALVQFQVWRICRRLGEKGIAGTYLIYDIFSPLYALMLWGAEALPFKQRRKWK